MSIFSRFKKKCLKRKNKELLKQRLEICDPLEKGIILFKEAYPDKHEMGIGSYGIPIIYCNPESESKVIIGKYCSIADGVEIQLGGKHFMKHITTSPLWILDDTCSVENDNVKITPDLVTIGNDVWLCRNTFILPNVTIGHGAIVAANTTVSKDVPPYAVVAGNPATIIKYRFSPDIIQKLLEIAWWDFPVDEIRKISSILNSEDIEELINYANNR